MTRELQADLQPRSPELKPLIEQVATYQGKQLRAAMVFLAGQIVRGPSFVPNRGHFVTAKVVELIHLATLIHDDVLDGAEMRRQSPTMNQLHGNEVPVLLGDYVFALAFQMSLSLDDLTCSRLLADVTRTICQGEICQSLHRLDEAWSEERYYQVIADKTASLYAAAGRLGAHYAGADDETCRALWDYGMNLGVAFQIVDDCLDLSGDETVVGKSLGTDLAMGKLTLPLLYLWNRNGNQDHLRSLLSGSGSAPELASQLAREFDLAGAVEFAGRQAQSWSQRAREALTPLPESPAKEALASVADYVLQRRF